MGRELRYLVQYTVLAGDFDLAIERLEEWLDRAHVRRSNQVIFAKVDPQLGSVRDDERFQALIESLGL